MTSRIRHPNALDLMNPKSIDPACLVNQTIGPLFVAFALSGVLYGLSCAQSCLFFKQYAQDSTRLKCIVITVLFLETLNIAFFSYGMFVYTIFNHGNFSHINDLQWAMLFQVVPANLVVTIVQYVWIVRIRILSRGSKRMLAVALLISIFIEAVLSIVWVILARTSTRWGQVQMVKWISVSSFVLRTVNDISLTSLLCYHLQRSKNGLRETDGMIRTMIEYGLRAGVLNCVGSIVLMLLVIVTPTKPYYVGVHVLTARVYANSLLAILNWRPQRTQSVDPQVSDLTPLEVMELSTANWVSMASQVTQFTLPECK